MTASAFSYATVSVGTGSTLRLPAGTYQIKDVNLSAGARIEAVGPVQIRIANRLCATSGAFIGAKADVTLTAKDIRIEISGKNGTGGGIAETPRAAAFQIGGRSAVRAPGATIVGNGRGSAGRPRTARWPSAPAAGA